MMDTTSSADDLRAKATIDPYVAQEMGRQAYDIGAVDWSKAAWDRVPALRNLQKLSSLSRLDMGVPPADGLAEVMAGSSIGLTPSRTRHEPAAAPIAGPNAVVVDDAAEVPVLHPAAAALLELSPEGRRVPRAEFLRVNEAVDLHDVAAVEDMCVRERVPERLSRTILGMKQLLGLSDLTTANDEQFMDLVGAIADSNRDDRSIVQLIIKSGVKFNASSSLSHLAQRRHVAKYPNRGFYDSDISAYPNLSRWEDLPNSMHDVERKTWQQRHLDIGSGAEDPDRLEAYQDQLTTAEGRLAALMERLEAISSEHSPYRERVLHPAKPSEREEVADTLDETTSTCVSPSATGATDLIAIINTVPALDVDSGYLPPVGVVVTNASEATGTSSGMPLSEDAGSVSKHSVGDEAVLSTSRYSDPPFVNPNADGS